MRPFASKIILTQTEAPMNPTSEELAKVILYRIGLMPRKRGATEKMFRTFLELYERAKSSYRDKKPDMAVMTVEEMGLFAGITRQTMYDYLGRWLELGLIQKATYIRENKVVVGYRLTGNTLEAAFEKAMHKVNTHMDQTIKYVTELQKLIKNEKISQSQKMKNIDREEEQDKGLHNNGVDTEPAEFALEQEKTLENEDKKGEPLFIALPIPDIEQK